MFYKKFAAVVLSAVLVVVVPSVVFADVDDVLPHGFGGTAYGHRVFPTSSQDSPAPLYRSRSDTRVDLLAGIHLPAQRT